MRSAEKGHYLLKFLGEPVAFLEAQQRVLYANRPKRRKNSEIRSGLPIKNAKYLETVPSEIPTHDLTSGKKLPKVLNIASGSDKHKQIPHAVNIDLSGDGRPTVIADARALPFKTGAFTGTMASHVLEHFKPDEIEGVLKEWARVTHKRGVLRVAVPDAKTVLAELEEGKTAKGEKAWNLRGSPTMTQIFGLASEDPKTDDRWRHYILFSQALLAFFLNKAGFVNVKDYNVERSLSRASGIKTDEVNRYSLRVEATRAKEPELHTEVMSRQDYIRLKHDFETSHAKETRRPLSIVIPVSNEEKKLPTLVSYLEKIIGNAPSTKTEVIFVLNNCCDESGLAIAKFLRNSKLKYKIVESEKGILPAFKTGIDSREYDGFVAKLDADTLPEDFSLGLMYMFLSENSQVQVTYAYPEPIEDKANPYNIMEKFQYFRSRRNYFHGRFSMYKENPFNTFDYEQLRESGAIVEDMALSSAFAYYFGLASIEATPHAIVLSSSEHLLEQLVHQRIRIRKENKRILSFFPQFHVLKEVLGRDNLLPENEDGTQLSELQKYVFFVHSAISHLARAVAPTGLEEHKSWDMDFSELNLYD